MKIVRVKATPLNVPVTIDILGMHHTTSLSVCLTEIESDTGLIGHGLTGITEEEIIAAAVREVAAPALIGEDPLATERLWEKLYWLLSPRGQTGYASHVIAALDVAVSDSISVRHTESDVVWCMPNMSIVTGTFRGVALTRTIFKTVSFKWVA